MAYTLNTNLNDPEINNGPSDERQTAMDGIRTTMITSAGGGRTSSATSPFTGVPVIPKSRKVVSTPTLSSESTIPTPPVYTPPTPAPQPGPMEETPKGLPAKDPQPAMPTIPPANRPISIRADRYKVGTSEWEITALSEGVGEKPNITPLKFGLGTRPELKPLLKTNGVVVQVGEHYLVSPQTLADIRDAGNPHYDIVENGRVLSTPMGKTVPIIVVNTTGLEATGSLRDIVNGFAAVKSVEYIYETPTIMGVPEGILEQINYTLDADTQRPDDSFQIWELNLTGDYSIEKLTIDNAQADGKLDKAKLEAFTKGVGARLKILQKDLNIIKGIFYRGELAEADRKQSVKITRRAKSDTTEEESQRQETTPYLIKNTEVTGHQTTPNSTQLEDPTTQSGNQATPVLPEIEVSPSDGIIAPEINRAGLERYKLLDDWNSYGFTPAEKAEIKSTPIGRLPIVKVTDGTEVGIGSVRWSPLIADKARVILPYTEGRDTIGRRSLAAQFKWRELWDSYYGFANRNGLALNRQRIAELLHLAAKIRELELADSKTY